MGVRRVRVNSDEGEGEGDEGGADVVDGAFHEL